VDEGYSEDDVRRAAGVRLRQLAGARLAVEESYRELAGQIEGSQTLLVIGGDPALAADPRNADYAAWAGSIPANLNLAALDVAGDLRGIWELAGTPGRRKVLEAAARDYLKLFEVDERLDVLYRDSAFTLQ